MEEIESQFSEEKISIIIPVFNGLRFLSELVKSILNNQYKNYEVIIVDDNSEIEDMEVLYKHLRTLPNFKIIKNRENLGFAKSNNIGVHHSEGKYLYLLNSDTIIFPDTLVRVYEFSKRFNYKVVQSLLLKPMDNGDLRTQTCGATVSKDGEPVYFNSGLDKDSPKLKSLKEVDLFTGCGVLIERRLYDFVGGFDENYGKYYYEDSDLALKIREKGEKIGFCADSIVIHFHGVSTNAFVKEDKEYWQNIEKSKKRFHARWPKEKIFEVLGY